MSIKPRGQVFHSNIPRKAEFVSFGDPTIEIVSWCPDEKAKEPPEQVHMIFSLPGLEEIPIVLRYKSPDTLGFIIEELTKYRRHVWPDAQKIEGESG